jgi:hypothetical protein
MLEEHNKKGRTRDLHQQIREVTGKPKINKARYKAEQGLTT